MNYTMKMKDMKKEYMKPALMVVTLDNEDVLAGSPGNTVPGGGDDGGDGNGDAKSGGIINWD